MTADEIERLTAALADREDKYIELVKERDRLRAALDRALTAMTGVTVFVGTREQIRRPEGAAWWKAELDAAREALAGGKQSAEGRLPRDRA